MQTVFETRTGSRAYGMELESSDCDVLRLVVNGVDEYLGLQPYKESTQFKNAGKDITVYDFRFFGKLLCAGNPNAILPLFFDRTNYTVLTSAFEDFLINRRFFLGPKMIDSFRGMAYQSALRFQQWASGEVVGDTGAWKSAANALYMYAALKGIALYGGLGFSDTQLEFLRNVKKGRVDADEVLESLADWERRTTKGFLNYGVILSSQEKVFENVNREVVNLVKSCLNI